MAAAAATVGAAVPALKRWVVKQIVLCNTNTTTARAVTLAIGTVSTDANTAGKRILSAMPVAPNATTVINTALDLEATELFSGFQSAGTDVTITVTGVEVALL